MERLSILRKELDELDGQLMDLLARRFAICREVARHKAAVDIPMMQPARVMEVKRRAGQRALSAGLDEQFGFKLYELIIAEACRMEDRVIGELKRM